VFQIRNNNPND